MKDIICIVRNAFGIEFISDRGNKLSWKKRCGVYARYTLPYIGALIMVFLNPNGFEDAFVNLLVSVLSITVGVFVAILIFAIDTLFVTTTNCSELFSVSYLKEGIEVPRVYKISVEKIDYQNTKQKDWRLKSKTYAMRIVNTLSMNVVVSVGALLLLFLYVFAPTYWGISIDGYEMCALCEINMESMSLFFHLLLAGGIRMLILSFTLSVLIYTCFLIVNVLRYINAKNSILSSSHESIE